MSKIPAIDNGETTVIGYFKAEIARLEKEIKEKIENK